MWGYLIRFLEDNYSLPVIEFIQNLSTEYEILGQQMYNGGAIFGKWGIPSNDLSMISTQLDELSKFEKSIHVTGQSVPSKWKSSWKNAGWWHRKWDSQTQSEFLKLF
jgi:hypothetical protein